MKKLLNFFKADIGLWVTFGFGISLLMGRLGDSGLRNDNILYASISKNILTASNRLLMTFAGEAYNNKPPLFFWLNSASIWLFGTNSLGAKLITVLSTIIIAMLVYKIAKKVFKSENAGYIAVILFITNYVVFKNTIACRMESMLTLLNIASLYAGAVYFDKGNTKYLYFAAFLSGLSVMTKGPAGALAFIVIILMIVISGRLKGKNILPIAISLMVFLITFGWWYTYAHLNSDFINVFIGKESIGRMTMSDGFDRNDPITTYIKLLASYSLIHCLIFLGSLYKNFKTFKTDWFFILSMVFSFFYLIAIHMLSTKYSRYLFIVIPLFSIYGAGLIYHYLKFEMRYYIAGLSIVVLFFFATYAGSFGKPSYKGLNEVQEIAKINKYDIYASSEMMNNWEPRAAIDFYLDTYKAGLPDKEGDAIYIVKGNEKCQGILILKDKRVKACIK